jgi:hypothetical protein
MQRHETGPKYNSADQQTQVEQNRIHHHIDRHIVEHSIGTVQGREFSPEGTVIKKHPQVVINIQRTPPPVQRRKTREHV